MINIYNFQEYSNECLKIKTKIHGLQSFRPRKYQLKFLDHIKRDFPNGIVRSISLKPRQAGWSTLIAGINMHAMNTRSNERGIMLADKFARTNDVHSIYSTFVENLPKIILPMISANNSEEIVFENPNKDKRGEYPGLGSSLRSETAQDPFAGRSGTRMFAHLSEYSFYPYASSIDEGVQNSIPLAKGTRIFKESTANGMGGIGLNFYELWMAAEAGESIYKPFFVPWYEIDDYSIEKPRDFIISAEEADMLLRFKDMTVKNLAWRRLKVSEYSKDPESNLPPGERFKQDFPCYPEEAFLFSGRPVFDIEKLRGQINDLRTIPPPIVKVKIVKPVLAMFPQMLTVFNTPIKGKKYFIGADVAEGLEIGDNSSAFVMDDDYKQVALFHGKIDPDLYGRALVELAKVYNRALIVPEKNNMGHTTINAIKQENYTNVYFTEIDDRIEKQIETNRMGWVTTQKSKQKMINKLVQCCRDDENTILDIGLLRELTTITRESDGNIELNGKDKTVACCLALMGTTQAYEPATVYFPEDKKERFHFEKRDESIKVALKSRQ